MSSVRRKKWNIIGKYFQKNVEEEGFLDNTVDKNMQAMLLPLTLTQTVVLSPKFRIKNNVLTPNNGFYKLLLFCGTVLPVSLYCYRMSDLSHDKVVEWRIISMQKIAVYWDAIFDCTGFIFNFFIHLVLSKKNVSLVLTIQKIHRVLNGDDNFQKFTRNNWISMIVVISVFILFFIYNRVLHANLPLYVFITASSPIVFDIDLILAIRYIKLLEVHVVLWNHQILNQCFDHQNETCRKRLFEVYFQILESYNIYKQIFQVMVSANIYFALNGFFKEVAASHVTLCYIFQIAYYTVNNLFHSLVYVEILVQYCKTPKREKEWVRKVC